MLKTGEDEAAMLVDGYDERALAQLGVPEVVVTLGSRGCIVYHHGVAELVRSRRVEARAPTGAGDAFAATSLAARSAGAAPTAAARRAAALVADVLAGRASGSLTSRPRTVSPSSTSRTRRCSSSTRPARSSPRSGLRSRSHACWTPPRP